MSKLKADALNTAGVVARRLGDQFSRLHLWLYGVSGTLDSMADTAGYWNHHDAPPFDSGGGER